jgi:thioredoxin
MIPQAFADRLTSHTRPVIVDLWAPWCAPCRWMAPMIECLESEYDGRVDVWRVNADEQSEVVRGLGVIGIPTLVAYSAGREVMRKVGAGSEADLRAVFESALSGTAPVRRGIALGDRVLRLAAGAAIVLLGFGTGPSLLLLGVGGLVLFTAVADRCPIWQAIRPRLAALVGRGDPASTVS